MSLVHLIREPRAEPEGALILLHGRGADERDLHPLLDYLDPDGRLVGVTPGAPMTGVPPGGRHWYLVPRVGYPDHDSFHAAYDAVTGFLDGFLAERGIGWERTVLGGFSMGAVMSYATALGPGRPSPAAVLAFSGFVPTVDGWSPTLEGRESTPVFITHGSQDPIIPVGFARRAHELIPWSEYLETTAPHAIPLEAAERAREIVATAV